MSYNKVSSDTELTLTATARPNAFWIVIALSLGFVMAMLDVTVVNVALTKIEHDFDAPLSLLVWVVDAYTLTFAALLLLGGSVADRLGAKRTYMLGLLWFIVASGLCAFASSGALLVGARLLQGIGAAMFMPSSLSLLTQSFPDKSERAKLLGIWGAIVGAAAGAGPFIGGLLVSSFGWRSIFYLNIPIGIAGALLTAKFLSASPKKIHPFDAGTHALIMLCLSAFSFALIQGPTLGWSSFNILVTICVAIAALIVVVCRERIAIHPVIPRSLSTNPRFWAFNAMGFSINVALFGQIFLLSLYLQKALGASALVTGIYLLPVMCFISIFNVRSGHLSNRWGLTTVLGIGLGTASFGALIAAFAGANVPYWILVIPLGISNAGLGLALPAMSSGMMQEAGSADGNVAAAALNANRQVGALSGVAVIGIMLVLVDSWLWRMRIGFALFSFCLALACVMTWLSDRRQAESHSHAIK
ncbi:MFS transporter [Caballeronia sp. 15715]|uniref:MFS transporter n=1 Tax=Caballeronia sp. 15715 TaxID=3391030 RepID=UPI0039E23B40